MGYNTNNKTEVEISKWANDNDFHLHFNPKERGTFFSKRWRQEYNPDLAFVSKNNNFEPILTKREVLNDFPHSQHRHVLITSGFCLPNFQSLPLPRWNFQKAIWPQYAEDIEFICQPIPPKQKNFLQFIKLMLKSAKKNIPRGLRKKYILDGPRQQYELSPDTETANKLFQSLQIREDHVGYKPLKISISNTQAKKLSNC